MCRVAAVFIKWPLFVKTGEAISDEWSADINDAKPDFSILHLALLETGCLNLKLVGIRSTADCLNEIPEPVWQIVHTNLSCAG